MGDNQKEVLNKDDVNSITLYLQEIGQIPLLSIDLERELSIRSFNGDEEAKKELVKSNLRLVVNIAKTYLKYEVPFLDLIQEGNLGLIKAADKYDPSKNAKFSTYAAYWIKQSMTRAIANKKRMIRLPIPKYNEVGHYLEAVKRLGNELGRNPTLEEVSMFLDQPVDEVTKLSLLQNDTLSLNNSVNDGDDDLELEGIIADSLESLDDFLINQELSRKLSELLDKCKLTKTQKEFLILRFGLEGNEPMSLQAIANKYHRTRQWVDKSIDKALDKIRESHYALEFAIYMQKPDEAIEKIKTYKKSK